MIKRYIKDYFFPVVVSLFFVIFFYLSLSYFDRVSLFYDIKSAEKVTKKANAYFQKNEDYLLSVVKVVATNPWAKEIVKRKDISAISQFVKDEKFQNKLDGFLIADSNGEVLSRANASSYRGDYVFETTSWGRMLAKQDDVVGVGMGAIWPLIISGGKQLRDVDGKSLGVVLAISILNNDYANAFKNAIGYNIAFYSQEDGIVGDSFNNNKISRKISSYFVSGSNLLTKDNSYVYVKVDGANYFVYYKKFENSIENAPGGFLLFIPDNGGMENILWSVCVSIGLFLIYLVMHQFRMFAPTRDMKKWHAIFLGILVALTVTFPVTYIITKGYIFQLYTDISEPTRTIYNSTLSISPQFGVFQKGVERQIKIVVSSGGEAINLVQAVVKYDPKLVSVADISLDNSFCAKGLLIDQSIDNTNGEVRVACVVMLPEFSGSPMTVATLFIDPKENGNLPITFGDESSVLASDGLGTNVLRLATGGSYELVDSLDKKEGSPFIVFSPTHPNSTRWYNSPTVKFLWRGEPNASYDYEMNATTSMSSNHTNTTNNEVTLSVGEGVHYFHLQETVNGKINPEVKNYPVRVDLTPPEKPVVQLSNSVVKQNESVRVVFSSRDSLSGLQRNFYVSHDFGVFLPLSSPMVLSFFDVGYHFITIRAYDNAGNFSDTTVTLTVEK